MKKVLGVIVVVAAAIIGLTQFHFNFGGGGGGGGGGSGGGRVAQANLDTTIHKTCHASTGEPTWCTITITNESTSNVEFDWTGNSDPGGAVFEPSSGSIAIGATSNEIKVTLAACPSTVLFQDKDHSIQTGTRVDFCDPNQLG